MTPLRSLRLLVASVLTVAAGLGLAVSGPAPTATAAARVSLANPAGGTVIDATYATTLTVEGAGFQSVRGGHGGVYVFFGTVNGRWQPSKGGKSGDNYLYVPDAESSNNQGFQQYLAFPSSDTGDSSGGTVRGDGTFRTTITVPGATFQAVGRDGTVRTVDCRRVRCGVITVGAHGVVNARNETFTPVTVGNLHRGDAAAPAADGGQASGSVAAEQPGLPETSTATGDRATPRRSRVAATDPLLEVDRASTRAGGVMPFRAAGLPAGSQVSVVLDDGRAAAGPFLVGADGAVAGVLTLPADLSAGTHELRVFGPAGSDGSDGEPVIVRFAVSATQEATADTDAAEDDADAQDFPWGPLAFGGSLVLLVAALARTLVAARRGPAS